MNARKWMLEYGVAMVLTFVFAVILGHITLFRQTTIGKLHAKSGKGIYNWIFIAAIVASSVWLILSWVQKCAALVAAMDSRKLRKAA